MPGGNWGMGLVGGALLAAILVGQAQLPPSSSAPEALAPAPSKPAARAGCCEPPPPPACAGEQVLDQYRQLYGSASAAAEPRFLVALVPDPEESGHTDYFDAVLEGVEEAVAGGAEGAGAEPYVRDRHWFPWPGSNADKRRAGCWKEAPGIVLYRPVSDPATHPPLVVLLVGETPTWGVREAQLLAAFRWADAAQPARSRLDVLGPTFSGSTASLAAVMQRHARAVAEAGRGVVFHVASGTATGEQVGRTLVDACRQRLCEADYRSAVPTDAQLLAALREHIEHSGGGSRRAWKSTLILTESMTAYGENVGSRGAGADVQPLQRRFPPNLASIRRAHTEVERAETLPTGRAPSDAEPTPEEQRGELSGQTPITHDLALAEVLRGVQSSGTRNVGIVATDANDVIFMAKRIKQQLPDLRLFTIGFDIRYLHPDHAPWLNGMLVAHAGAEPGQPAPPSTVQENHMTRGVWAAGRHLLAGRSLLPSARVSLIGNGALWRLTSDVREPGQDPTQVRGVRVPRGYYRVFYWVAVLAGLLGLLWTCGPRLIEFAERPPSRPWSRRLALHIQRLVRPRSGPWLALSRCQHRDLAADDAFATASLVTLTVSFPLVLAAPLLRLGPSWGALGVSLLACGLAAVSWWNTRGHWHAEPGVTAYSWRWWRSVGTFPTILALLIAGIGIVSTSLGCSEPRELTFSVWSGASPLSGAVPGLGMLWLVVLGWRTRLRLLDNLCFGPEPRERDFFAEPVLPITRTLALPAGSHIGATEQRLLGALRSPWAAPYLPSIVLIAFLMSSAYIWIAHPLTFEQGWRHQVLVGFSCVCMWPIAASFARILVTARLLMRLLRCVSCLPVANALRKLPDELARRLETQVIRDGRDVSELVYPVQTFRELAQHEPELRGDAEQLNAALEEELAYEAGRNMGELRPSQSPASAPTSLVVTPPPARTPAWLLGRLLGLSGELNEAPGPKSRRSHELIEEYRARLLSIFVARYVRHLRLPIPPVLIGSGLAILMTSLYFVQPQRTISMLCFLWVTAMVIGIGSVYFDLVRDRVISLIGGTPAGELSPSWGLVGRVLGVTLVPVASWLSTQYPDFAVWIGSLLGGAHLGK